MMGGGIMDMGGFMGWGGMFIGPLVVIVTIGIVIGLIVMMFSRNSDTRTPNDSSSSTSPVDILKARFARGEIDTREYEEKRRILDN